MSGTRQDPRTGSRLAPGDAAPPFDLPSADGGRVSSADLRRRKAVVYFYPSAGTPGCTAEACDFRDSLASLAGAGYAVVGISPTPRTTSSGFATSRP